MVERRDEGKEWGIGIVTSVYPHIKVTWRDDDSDGRGRKWDEVRSLEEAQARCLTALPEMALFIARM